MPEKSDRELIESAKQGDGDAFRKLMEKYSGNIYTLCYRLTGNETFAKDIFQETFLHAYKSIGKFQEKSEFATWLHRIAVNLFLSEKRKPEHRKVISLDTLVESPDSENEMPRQLADSSPAPDKEYEKMKIQEAVQSKLSLLDEGQRTVIVLRYVEDKSYEEIAQICNCSKGTVGSRIYRAFQELRSALLPIAEELLDK